MSLQSRESRFLDARVVVVIDIVDADHFLASIKESVRNMRADETSCAGDERCHKTRSLQDEVERQPRLGRTATSCGLLHHAGDDIHDALLLRDSHAASAWKTDAILKEAG